MNTNHDNIEDRLDDALELVKKRAAAAAQPDGELGELLQLATTLRTELRVEQPSTLAIERGRARLLNELRAMQQAAATPSTRAVDWRERWAHWWQSLPLSPEPVRRLAFVVILLMALTIGTGAFAASADSLPGDPLYILKRVGEQATLTLTFDPQAHEALTAKFDEVHRQEVDRLLQLHKMARTEIRGILTHIDHDQVWINHLKVTLRERALVDIAHLNVGDSVLLIVQTNADETVDAFTITRDPTTTPAPSATPTPTVTPLPTATSTPHPTPSATSTTGALPAGHPTASSEVTREPTPVEKPTREREPTRIEKPTDTPKPTRTERPTNTPRPTDTRTPTRTPRPAEPTRNPRSK